MTADRTFANTQWIIKGHYLSQSKTEAIVKAKQKHMGMPITYLSHSEVVLM